MNSTTKYLIVDLVTAYEIRVLETHSELLVAAERLNGISADNPNRNITLMMVLS